MKIEQAKNFILLLDAASITPGVYISQASDSKYRLVSSRDKKNLNTDQIATIAEGCFDKMAMHTADLGKLATSLRNYQERVYRSKPWHLRIACFFGRKSQGEKRIDSLIHKAAEKISDPVPLVKNDYLSALITALASRHPPSQKDQDRTQIKLFYHKVLDSKTRRKGLDGNSRFKSTLSVLNDLIQYMADSSHISQKHMHLVEDVQFALSLAELKFTRNVYFSDHAQRIVRRINELPEKTEDIRHAVIIPGGSVHHAVLYVVERSTTGNFSFKIVNTGQGSTESMDLIDESGVIYPSQKDAVVDIQYTDLTTEQLSQTFFENLERYKTTKKMSEVNAYIEKQLLKAGHSNLRIAREHKEQHNGTCSLKCLMAYIRERLGEAEYRKFKLWMTDQEIARFERISKRNCVNFKQEDLAALRREAEEVRQKRARKVTA